MARAPKKAPDSSRETIPPEKPAKAEDAGARPISWFQAVKEGNDAQLKVLIKKRIEEILLKYNLENYAVLILFDDVDSISSYHSDALYAAASAYKDKSKDILLLVHSGGGSIEPAYLISKTLKRIAHKKFAVAVARRAKSAATLLSLGADEIHLGMLSELGPIDPQIGGLPALL